MKKRICGSALLLLFLGTFLFLGGSRGAVCLILLFSLGSLWELDHLFQKLSFGPLERQVYTWTLLIPIGAWSLPAIRGGIWLSLLAILFLVIRGILRFSPQQLFRRLIPSLVAILYIPLAFQFAILLLREGNSPGDGLWILCWSVWVIKLGDVGGLLVGTPLGRHALSRDYSPSKTWEGFGGGIAAAMLGGFFLWIPLHNHSQLVFPIHWALPLAVLLAAVGTVSDLLESALKRLAGVKDSGSLIPGMGGCLDFCDSLILGLPVAYLVLQLAKM
jgi:phosphatidate cytidylyltransferase